MRVEGEESLMGLDHTQKQSTENLFTVLPSPPSIRSHLVAAKTVTYWDYRLLLVCLEPSCPPPPSFKPIIIVPSGPTLPFLLPISSQIPRPGSVAFLGMSMKRGWTGDRREMAEDVVLLAW